MYRQMMELSGDLRQEIPHRPRKNKPGISVPCRKPDGE
jgi:hypothetical protein